MTQRHYVEIAAALAGTRPSSSVGEDSPEMAVWTRTVAAIARVLASDNPRFKRERFVRAAWS